MTALDQLPVGTFVEFRGFDDWKGYASAMGYHLVSRAVGRGGFCRMRRDIGLVADVSCPLYFKYEIVS
jgi:hypothetical protein